MTDLRWIDRLLGRRVFEVPCTVYIEHTNECLHSEVDLEGFEVESGDEVRVIDAPTEVAYGDRLTCQRQARVMRGGPLDALWARVAAVVEFTELYDLSFSGRRQL